MNLRKAVQEKVESLRPTMVGLSRRIHAHPEVGFEEFKASSWIAEILSEHGFDVRVGVCGLPTAFLAVAGNGPLNVVICAEYDALPGVGHACGHNIIAAAAVGASIAASIVADEVGLRVTVIGTPGEEAGDSGGKILLLERGAFAGAHAAMMIHPAPYDILTPRIIAGSTFDVHYIGKAAHAAAFPELGINAADALTVAQTAIGLLRQHILPGDRIHGIVTKGGEAPNVVPADTSARYIVRGETLIDLERLRPRVYHCFEAGALATGAELKIVGGERPYSEMIHDRDIASVFERNMAQIGRSFSDGSLPANRMVISTDMGNVSRSIPSIHPLLGIESLPAVNHHPDFAASSISEAADQTLYDGALAMAWTTIDLALDGTLRDRLVRE